ncbi:hypothetical protein SDC9_178402 [bioreactor metagenome]|uniref:Uncharacterized protein n=1 Tax=bioreactor metagenome TaxID=1076179 RepID=A0A645GVN9_9ZZZZ
MPRPPHRRWFHRGFHTRPRHRRASTAYAHPTPAARRTGTQGDYLPALAPADALPCGAQELPVRPRRTPANVLRLRQPAARQPNQDLRYTPPHQSLLPSVPPLSARPGSAVRFYVRDRARPVLALRRRSQRVISPDYTIGWLKDLFHRRKWRCRFHRRMFQYPVHA